MLAASTPIRSSKRKADDDSPGISPIRRRRTASLALPKLPTGTTLEVLRGSPLKKRPLAENHNMGNLRKSTVEAQTKNSLAYLNEIISFPQPSVISKKRKSSVPVKQNHKIVHAQPHCVSRGTSDVLNPNLVGLDHPSKRNVSQFPELIVISETDEEPEHTVQHRARRSVASRSRKPIVATLNDEDHVPDIKDFVKPQTRLGIGSRVSVSSSAKTTKLLPVVDGCHGKAGSTFVASAHAGEYSTIIKSEPQDNVMIRNFEAYHGCAAVNTVEILHAPPNGLQRRTKNSDDFKSESQQRFEPEISKFAMADADSWKEMKEQQGVFFSKAPAPLSSGSDGDAFPARTGFLKMEAKKTLDIKSCANNVVFTVVKGKGRLKNKSEMNGAVPKTDMIVGDILSVPQGSTFNFVNLGTKNDLIMSYVKLS